MAHNMKELRFGIRAFSWCLSVAGSTWTELDRIGSNSSLCDGLPGALATAYPPVTNGVGEVLQSWAAAGIRWTQSQSAIAVEARFVVFGRTQTADPLTNPSLFHLDWHLWTNGAAGFFAHPRQGDLVVDGGLAPAAPRHSTARPTKAS